jgi:cell division protein FtsB
LKRELKKANKVLEKASAMEASRLVETTTFEKDSVAEVEKAKQTLEVKEVENIELKKRLEQLEKEVDDLSAEEISIEDVSAE